MTATVWPLTLLPSRVMFHPDIPSQSGGPALTGIEQPVLSSAGRWRARLSFAVRRQISARPRDRILAARAMLAHLKGRSNTIYMGPYDNGNGPAGLAGGQDGMLVTPHSDDALFSDGAGYATRSAPAHLFAAAAEGDLALTVVMEGSGQAAEAGQYFGFGLNELYLIETAIDNGGGNFSLTFWPPLRAAHAEGDDVNFSAPTCEMRLASDQTGELDFSQGFAAEQTLEFVEAL